MVPLRLINAPAVYAAGPAKASFAYWHTRLTADIVASLAPGQREALRVKPDGRVMNGNTRVRVFLDRGLMSMRYHGRTCHERDNCHDASLAGMVRPT